MTLINGVFYVKQAIRLLVNEVDVHKRPYYNYSCIYSFLCFSVFCVLVFN